MTLQTYVSNFFEKRNGERRSETNTLNNLTQAYISNLKWYCFIDTSTHYCWLIWSQLNDWWGVYMVFGDVMEESLWYFMISRPNLLYYDWLEFRLLNGMKGQTNHLLVGKCIRKSLSCWMCQGPWFSMGY